MTQKPTRIQDVARTAGVSASTVSRALSNPDLLSESTRTAVFEAIRETGYRVNQAARNLRKQRAGAVLILVPSLSNPFFSQILAGISRTLSDTEYSVLITDSSVVSDPKTSFVDYFLDSRVDGMISLDGGLSDSELQSFGAAGVADKIVFACEWVFDAPYPSVRSDNVKGARLAMRHLYDLGHRKIAHVTGPEGNVLTRMRRDGVLHERAALDLPSRPDWIIRGDFSLESGQQAARQILQMDERPTAVFCASDMVAFGLISELQSQGVSVPHDISVIGFDDIEMSQFYNPALSTIRQDRHALGARAANLLTRRLRHAGLDAAGQDIELVDVSLICRDSTAPPRDQT